MVCYYGRQVCKTGLSTNQPGLKMSGIGGFGGSKGAIRRYISRRVVSNLKPCGAISRHGVITGFRTTRCVKRASKCASIAGGVGRVNAPRFKCGNPKSDIFTKIEDAMKTIRDYFKVKNPNQIPILVAKKETLSSDLSGLGIWETKFGGEHLSKIKHYYEGQDEFISLPIIVQNAITFINNLELKGRLRDSPEKLLHVIGTASLTDMYLLSSFGYGVPLTLSPNVPSILMFQAATKSCLDSAELLWNDASKEVGNLVEINKLFEEMDEWCTEAVETDGWDLWADGECLYYGIKLYEAIREEMRERPNRWNLIKNDLGKVEAKCS